MVNTDSSGHAVWRPLAVVAGLVATAAAVLLYANRELAGDLFWLLAAGRYLGGPGAGLRAPFPTIAHGRPWDNQPWLSAGLAAPAAAAAAGGSAPGRGGGRLGCAALDATRIRPVRLHARDRRQPRAAAAHERVASDLGAPAGARAARRLLRLRGPSLPRAPEAAPARAAGDRDRLRAVRPHGRSAGGVAGTGRVPPRSGARAPSALARAAAGRRPRP